MCFLFGAWPYNHTTFQNLLVTPCRDPDTTDFGSHISIKYKYNRNTIQRGWWKKWFTRGSKFSFSKDSKSIHKSWKIMKCLIKWPADQHTNAKYWLINLIQVKLVTEFTKNLKTENFYVKKLFWGCKFSVNKRYRNFYVSFVFVCLHFSSAQLKMFFKKPHKTP